MLIGNLQNEGMYWLLYGLNIKGVHFIHSNGNLSLPSFENFSRAGIDLLTLITSKFVRTEYLSNPFPAIVATQYDFNSPGVQKVLNFNPGEKVNEILDSISFMNQLDNLSGELDFVCGTLEFATRLARKPGAKIQFYNFDYKKVNNGMPAWVGAMHGYEIEFIFGMPFSSEFGTTFYKFTEKERKLSENMMHYWANFARNG